MCLLFLLASTDVDGSGSLQSSFSSSRVHLVKSILDYWVPRCRVPGHIGVIHPSKRGMVLELATEVTPWFVCFHIVGWQVWVPDHGRGSSSLSAWAWLDGFEAITDSSKWSVSSVFVIWMQWTQCPSCFNEWILWSATELWPTDTTIYIPFHKRPVSWRTTSVGINALQIFFPEIYNSNFKHIRAKCWTAHCSLIKNKHTQICII